MLRHSPAALVALLMLVGAVPATACDCAPPPPPTQSLRKSAAVFAGKVINIEIKDSSKVVTFEVERVWKGELANRVVVHTGLNGAICGYGFTTKGDGRYMVYCYAEKDGPLHTNICTRTRQWSEAAADVKELGEGKKPKSAKAE